MLAECKHKNMRILVGYGKADITPGLGVELAGYGNSNVRKCRGVLSPLYALSVVMTDENGFTFVFIVADLIFGSIERNLEIREEVNRVYGIPGENVIFAATHDHSGPDDWSEAPENIEYIGQLKKAVMMSVEQAMNDREAAVMEIGRTQTKALNFCRRYIRADGNYLGGGPNRWNVPSTAPIVAHETPADEEIQLVRFVREKGKNILLVNWQSHACNVDGNREKIFHYLASGEWPAVMRDLVEKELGVNCVFIQGAAGNLATFSRIPGELAVADPLDIQEVGTAVAGYVTIACSNKNTFRQIDAGPVRTDRYQMPLEIRDDVDPADVMQQVELNTIGIGDLSFVTLPLEFFDTNAKWLKSVTPYEMTLIVGYACGGDSYLAPEWAFEHGCFEVLFGRYKKGSAEKIFNYYNDALNRLKQKQL